MRGTTGQRHRRPRQADQIRYRLAAPLSGNNSFNGAVVQDGMLELNGANTLTSRVEVQGGRLLLNGRLVSTALTTTGGVSTVSTSGVLDNSNLVVNGGVVSFNGTQAGGTATVGANGLLKGVGTLGNTRVDGIIAPGNSIGHARAHTSTATTCRAPPACMRRSWHRVVAVTSCT